MSHTFAILDLSPAAFAEIEEKLKLAGYHHAILDSYDDGRTVIDMHGIAVVAGLDTPPEVVVTCVFCGKEYPSSTPAAGAPILTEHIKVCEKHPLRAAEKELERLRGF